MDNISSRSIHPNAAADDPDAATDHTDAEADLQAMPHDIAATLGPAITSITWADEDAEDTPGARS